MMYRNRRAEALEALQKIALVIVAEAVFLALALL